MPVPNSSTKPPTYTIRIQRLDIADLLADNPSLKPYLDEALARAYIKGVALAIKETNLPEQTFPVDYAYPLEDILNDDFYPGETS